MNVEQAEILGIKLIREHLTSDWSFVWANGKTVFGSCYYKTKTIRLSKSLTVLNTLEHVTDTILHEIAHALAGFDAGHGATWKTHAKILGANPRATSKEGILDDPKYVMFLPSGTILKNYYRKPNASTYSKLASYYQRGNKEATLGTVRVLTYKQYLTEFNL